MTASEFTIELAKASSMGTIPAFQEFYRRTDVFVCEDLQTLQGRKSSQQQLTAIIDAVLTEGGRVLLTSDRAPGDWPRFSSKLKNRCVGGVCAATELPSFSSREKFLWHFAEERGITLSPAVVRYVAESLAASPRELRGIVIQLEQHATRHGQRIDCEIAQNVIEEAVSARRPTVARIAKVVAHVFDVSIRDLKSQSRYPALVLPRQVAMFAAREGTQQRYSEIGRYFGRRSHSTIVHACQRIREKIASDPEFRQFLEFLTQELDIPKTVIRKKSTSC